MQVKSIEMQVEPEVKAKEKLMYNKIEDESQGKRKGDKARQIHLNTANPQHTSNTPTQQLQQHSPKTPA